MAMDIINNDLVRNCQDTIKMKIKVGTAILSVLSCMPIFATSVLAADWTIIPAITVAEIYTDDVDLDSNFAQSDFVTQTTVGGIINATGTRLNLNVNYGLTHIYYPGLEGDKDEFRHQLQAAGTTELVEDHFFLDVNAGITQQFIDRRQSFSTIDITRSANRATVGIYDVSPYYVRKVNGNFATLTARYRFSHVDTSRNVSFTGIADPDVSTSFNEGSAILSSGTKFSKLFWNFTNSYRKQTSNNRRNNDIYLSALDGGYSLNRYIAAVGTLGYSKRNATFGAATFSSVVWDAGVILTPGPRTSLELRVGETSFGRTYVVNGSYTITPNLAFSINYQDRLDSYQSLLLENFLGGQDNAAAVQQDFIDDVFVRRKQWNARLTGTRGRTTIALTATNTLTASEVITRDQTRNSIGAVLSRTMSTRLNINAAVHYIDVDFKIDNNNDKFMSYSAGANYRVSQSLLATVEFIHTKIELISTNFNPRSANLIMLSLGATF